MLKLDLIVLGILRDKPRSIGSIEAEIKARNIHKIVRCSLASIYRKVKLLEEEGFIKEKEVRSRNRVEAKIYEISTEGIKFFHSAMINRASNDINVFLDINAILVNFNYLERDERLICFEKIKEQIKKTNSRINKIYLEKEEIDYSDRIIYSQQEKIVNALEEWILECENEIKLYNN